MSAPLRPSVTRGLLSVCFSPLDGPDRMLSTTFAFSGSRIPGSGGGRFRFELEALALANEGSGDMTTVESTRRLISTMVVFPHFEHLICSVWPQPALRTRWRSASMLRLQAPDHSGERACPNIFRARN